MRSLKVNSYRASLVAILLASAIMLALVVWFFAASITLFEVSNTLSMTEEGRLIARFPAESMARLRQGQLAVLQVSVGSDQSVVSVPGMVFTIAPDSNDVEIALNADEIPENLPTQGLKGQVQVEAEYVTPAMLVMRAMGKYLNRSQIPVTPQETPAAP
jgi:hypothetical protein